MKYKFDDCGHIREMPYPHVEKGKFRCDICFWDNWHERLADKGVQVIADGATKQTRLFKILGCGHIQEMNVNAVMDGYFVCRTCNETAMAKPSNLYLLRMIAPEFEWLKLGYAKNINRRVKQYALPSTVAVEQLYIVPTDTGEEARNMETAIKKKFYKDNLNGETMKQWHRLSGFTECFKISSRKIMINELQLYG